MSLPFSAVPNAAPTPTGAAPPSFPELYERVLVGPLFGPWAGRLLDRVPLPDAARVLDVACGTGIVSRLARQRLGGRGTVVGVDLSPAMLATARAVEPAIDWREGSADQLPIGESERFDAVFCHQGLQFFPDRPAAAREMRRALAPGGRIAVGVWRAVEENGLFHDLNVVGERFLGPVMDVRYAFADADALAALLREAGFSGVQVEPVSMDVRFECEPPLLARLNAMALVGMSTTGKSMADSERSRLTDEIVSASLAEFARYTRDGAITFPMSANIATAHA